MPREAHFVLARELLNGDLFSVLVLSAAAFI